MSGDVVARARELMRDVEGYGDWILEPNEDSNGAYHVHSSSGSCIAEFSDRGDARFAANARMLVPELIEYALDEHAAADHWHVLWQQNVETASAAMRERDAANAEVEKLRRGGKELGRIIERQCRDVLNITGLHHLIGPDGDGDWGLVWERLAEMAAAGAEVEKLRASRSVCQCWVGHGDCGGCSGVVGYGHEPACGWEWNPRCPEHGALAEENRKLRGALETIRGIATGPRDFTFRADILSVIERAGIEP